VGRRSGGVAILIRKGIDVELHSVINDVAQYETLWLRVFWNMNTIICAVVYHPPKPIYNTLSFKDFLIENVDLAENLP